MTLDPSSAARWDQRLDLVDENNAARFSGGSLEELLDVLFGFANPLAQQVGRGDAKEGGVDFAGWWPWPASSSRCRADRTSGRRRRGGSRTSRPAFGVLERIDHLEADVFLDVVEAGHAVEP